MLLFLLFPELELVTTTVLVWLMVSPSLFVLIALLVTDKVCRIVGLLLFVIATVTLVFGEPMLDTSTSIPPVCDTINASATPKPVIK